MTRTALAGCPAASLASRLRIARKILAKCERADIAISLASDAESIVVRFRGELPSRICELLRRHKVEILEWLSPASAQDLEAVAATGRTPSPRLTRGDAFELALLPPPVKPTKWELLVDGWAHDYPGPRWLREPASAAQLAFLRGRGFDPPAETTKGEASFAISALKGKQ